MTVWDRVSELECLSFQKEQTNSGDGQQNTAYYQIHFIAGIGIGSVFLNIVGIISCGLSGLGLRRLSGLGHRGLSGLRHRGLSDLGLGRLSDLGFARLGGVGDLFCQSGDNKGIGYAVCAINIFVYHGDYIFTNFKSNSLLV